VGVLVNGAVRDTATLSQLPIGIAALGKNPRPPAKIGKGEIDVPVTFGDITIEPGDFIVCDEDGVVVLPGGQTG
jgi:regulator of ribonuclease activity A